MWLVTLILLTVSNIFMTFAWYGHLRYKQTALWLAVLVSWLIAFMNIASRYRLIVWDRTPESAPATENHPGSRDPDGVLFLFYICANR